MLAPRRRGAIGAGLRNPGDGLVILGTTLGCDLRRTDYHKVAEGYGGVGLVLTDPARVDSTLAEAKAIAKGTAETALSEEESGLSAKRRQVQPQRVPRLDRHPRLRLAVRRVLPVLRHPDRDHRRRPQDEEQHRHHAPEKHGMVATERPQRSFGVRHRGVMIRMKLGEMHRAGP